MASEQEHDANGLPLKYDRHGRPINSPAMEFEIESIEVHWAGIARLLLGLVAMPLLLGTLGGGLAGACEPEHTLFSDYKWLASNWMFIHALICCVCLPLFLRALSTQGKEGFPNLLISPPQSNPEGGGQTPPRLLLSFCISI